MRIKPCSGDFNAFVMVTCVLRVRVTVYLITASERSVVDFVVFSYQCQIISTETHGIFTQTRTRIGDLSSVSSNLILFRIISTFVFARGMLLYLSDY